MKAERDTDTGAGVDSLDERIARTAEEMLTEAKGRKPSVFDTRRWIGKVMGWSLDHPDFRTSMLRFVDVFPALTTPDMLANHFREYFGDLDGSMPAAIRWGVGASARGGWLGTSLSRRAIAFTIDRLGRQFIIGETAREAITGLSKIRKAGCAFSVDILGEAVLSEEEAAAYASQYGALLDAMQHVRKGWRPLLRPQQGNPPLDWGSRPPINVSLKPTSLFSQARPRNFQGSVDAIVASMRPIYGEVREAGGELCIDMESYPYKDMSLEVYRRLRLENPAYPYLSIALQAYLKDTERDLPELLAWARRNATPVSIRLIKGAYWDYEILRARQNNWEIPVYTRKAETDAAFERHARLILENHEFAYLGCGSHNLRSLAAVIESARDLGVPDDRYEFQVLYGMAEPIREVLQRRVGRVRIYCPYGRIVPGMAYLVRRLLENTANQGFLRMMFSDGSRERDLVANPARALVTPVSPAPPPAGAGLPLFRNQGAADFTRQEERESLEGAIKTVGESLRRQCHLFINGRSRIADDTEASVNPADPEQVVAYVAQAGITEVDEAIDSAGAAFRKWSVTDPRVRADHLLKAAQWIRERRHELAAWQIYEIGKGWDQATADVAEAIDFLEYYAREMIRLGTPRALTSPSGEQNHQLYEPKGVAVVISPWNFPLAISAGMVAAALVTGNCVLFKPSPLTPLIGRHLVDAFTQTGLPPGVLNYVPGRAEVIGDYLVDHPAVSLIAFTGSTRVGMRILERAAVVRPGQYHVKAVICEMGGKNAIIVDEDADQDEAIPGVIESAFGFQGQKCSSCSRLIIVGSIYDAFVKRLIDAIDSLVPGPAADPASALGPVADSQARERINRYIAIGTGEGTLLYSGRIPEGSNYVPITLIGDIRPEHTIAREEIFGPVLAIMRAATFEQALDWANLSPFALTGGLYSRSPEHLDQARRGFHVGNLYLNRAITGALVSRQPFGGFRLSGLGTKAGGQEYLLHFMNPRVITENTARRGFAPDV